MPGFVLHQGATVTCLHGGQAMPTKPDLRVSVSGMKVTVQPVPYTVAGCTLPPPTAGNGPCVTAQWMTGALRVKASGQPLLVRSSQAVCAPTGTGVIIAATQIRVRAT
jgi:hypothetical protein